MGIDFGSKKVGIAFTDEGGSMAFPHSVVPNDASLLSTLGALIAEKDVEEIVIGHSLDKTGTPNAIHAQVEELMTDLTLAVGLPIHLEPEHYTTQQASRIMGKTANTDAAAAALILESFLSTHT
jgi:putative Holliday junction resolvase